MSAALENLHASAVQIAGQGVLILGGSGSGKSSLALELMREAFRGGHQAALVADDRVDIARIKDGLFASPPAALAGLVEVRGSGIHRIGYAASAQLHLAVKLVSESQAQRMPPEAPILVTHGVALPCLVLPGAHTGACMRAVLAHLGLFPPLLPQGKAV
jgi:serine kinase of HPr protein (carbohydrate metabolism regulator)